MNKRIVLVFRRRIKRGIAMKGIRFRSDRMAKVGYPLFLANTKELAVKKYLGVLAVALTSVSVQTFAADLLANPDQALTVHTTCSDAGQANKQPAEITFGNHVTVKLTPYRDSKNNFIFTIPAGIAARPFDVANFIMICKTPFSVSFEGIGADPQGAPLDADAIMNGATYEAMVSVQYGMLK